MDFSAEHVNYVILAYAVSAVVLVGLVYAILSADRDATRKLRRRKEDT